MNLVFYPRKLQYYYCIKQLESLNYNRMIAEMTSAQCSDAVLNVVLVVGNYNDMTRIIPIYICFLNNRTPVLLINIRLFQQHVTCCSNCIILLSLFMINSDFVFLFFNHHKFGCDFIFNLTTVLMTILIYSKKLCMLRDLFPSISCANGATDVR